MKKIIATIAIITAVFIGVELGILLGFLIDNNFQFNSCQCRSTKE